jgi:hypothetical protein
VFCPQVYPERLASLPPPSFASLLSTLRFGVATPTGDEQVTQARRGSFSFSCNF